MPPRQRPSTSPAPTSDSSSSGSPAGKGRPTPKRRQVEAARKRPLVTNRKEGIRAQRAADKATRDREYQAMLSGDERHLPARDKGPVRRWIRDYVDARRSPGEYLLPISVILMLATFLVTGFPILWPAVVSLIYVVILLTMVDIVLLARRLKKLLTAKFGAQKVVRGTVMYGVMRAFQMRRMRLPKPQVQRGQYPR